MRIRPPKLPIPAPIAAACLAHREHAIELPKIPTQKSPSSPPKAHSANPAYHTTIYLRSYQKSCAIIEHKSLNFLNRKHPENRETARKPTLEALSLQVAHILLDFMPTIYRTTFIQRSLQMSCVFACEIGNPWFPFLATYRTTKITRSWYFSCHTDCNAR